MQQQQDTKKPGLSWSTPAQPLASSSGDSKGPPNMSPGKPLLPAGSSKSSNTSMYVGLFVGGIIVGLLLAWMWNATHSGAPAVTAISTEVTSSTTQPNDTGAASSSDRVMQNNDLIVPSPQQAGQSVIITQAIVGSPTWIVVYENAGGVPGNVLGAQLFFTTGPGIVTLLRGTEAGQTYYVGKSVDNGDHKYTKTDDKPNLNLDGTLAVVPFVAN